MTKSWVTEFIDRVRGVPAKPNPLEFPACGGLYIVRVTEKSPVKMGIANDVNRCLSVLQSSHSLPLQLLYFEPIADAPARQAREIELHETYKDLRLKGTWFNPDLVAAIKGLAPKTLKAESTLNTQSALRTQSPALEQLLKQYNVTIKKRQDPR